MRVLFAGGGTGGHIYPALAVARTLLKRRPGTEILFVGTNKGLEADIVPKEGYPLMTITAEGLKREVSPRAFLTAAKVAKGCLEARRIIKKFRPSVVLGTGGYVCGPVVLMAALSGVPALIHEQNAYPGITNKALAPFVKEILLTFPGSASYFNRPEKTRFTGLPVRPEIMTSDRKTGTAHLGLNPEDFNILVTGGSRGADRINKVMLDIYPQYENLPGIHFYHITGRQTYEKFLDEAARRGIDLAKLGNITIVPYLYEMHHALAAADLCISRAGATFLTEIMNKGLPAILIPYPYAAENHQEHNARALVEKGGALLFREKELTGAKIAVAINNLLKNRQTLDNMRSAMKSLAVPDAAEKIVDRLLIWGEKT